MTGAPSERQGLGFAIYGQPDRLLDTTTPTPDSDSIAFIESETLVIQDQSFSAYLYMNVGFGFPDSVANASANETLYANVTADDPPPTLWAVAPAHSKRGLAVVLVGTGLGSSASEFSGLLRVNGEDISPVSWTTVAASGDAYGDDRAIDTTDGTADPEHQRITFTIPSTGTSGPVSVRTTTTRGDVFSNAVPLVVDDVFDINRLAQSHRGAEARGEARTPFQFDGGGGVAFVTDMQSKAFAHVVAAVATAPGERVMRAGFGANIQEVVFDPVFTSAGYLTAHVDEHVKTVDPTLVVESATTAVVDEAEGIVSFQIEVRSTETNEVHVLTITSNGQSVTF